MQSSAISLNTMESQGQGLAKVEVDWDGMHRDRVKYNGIQSIPTINGNHGHPLVLHGTPWKSIDSIDFHIWQSMDFHGNHSNLANPSKPSDWNGWKGWKSLGLVHGIPLDSKTFHGLPLDSIGCHWAP